ncbi:hypothetical protein [Chryseobacterium sp. MEBOG07]|uniref:hypothetical protein n=1 Tax=Chryseobacterium sp. MEBOG07 TaxID=2879939 RepID=UPI001F2DA53D|nr:hypothetical protein [Chryseobacterium sp. MEBOG07]UKB81396.1 hypothetical protein LF886_10505 [Chryseobacterium sp. MEBOG07]
MNQNNEFNEFILRNLPNSDYQLDLEIIKNPPKEYIDYFFKELKKHKQYEKLKNDFIYDEKLDIFAQIHNRFEYSEIEDLSEEEVFFYPFLSKEEIKIIFNIKSSEDYLLKLRAEQVENNIRLKRTFNKLQKKIGVNWSFTNYFESNQYKYYLKKLKPDLREKCKDIPHGTIHLNDSNGLCIKTPFGNIIVLSYSLRQFLYYMNIFHFGHQLGIKDIDTFHSFILANRIRLGTESLDFEIDPRGKLPKSIKRKIDYLTDWQMLFIIGHEYAHHYLGHLENSTIMKSYDRINYLTSNVQFYTYKQECEFEADKNAITNTLYNKHDQTELLDGAFLFFSYLDMCDKVEDYLFPKINYSLTHPKPLDRIQKLRQCINEEIGLSTSNLNNIIENNNNFIKKFLNEFLPYNVEVLETVGSAYLPSYKKKYLIDRLDL